MTPEPVRSKLWREGEDKHVYVILDGAQNPNLLEVIDGAEGLEYECLFVEKLEPDMEEMAPYLIELSEDSAFTRWVLDQGWAQNWGIFLTSERDLAGVWRNLRRHTKVMSPDKKLLYFRFYDPRVLNAFLPTCDSKQLSEFFGVVDLFIAETEGGAGAHAYSLAEDGQLVTEVVKAV